MELEEKARKYLILKFAHFVFFLSLRQILCPRKIICLTQQMSNTALRHNSAKHSSWNALSQITLYPRHTDMQHQVKILPSDKWDFD